APVRRGGDVLGALCFATREPGTYTPDDIQVATLMAAGLSSALETSRAYQALADERSTLAAVVGSMQDAVVMANQDGIVLLANPAVRPMLNLEPGATDPRFATWCERIMKTSDYMTELITDLLDLGKIESGLELAAEEVDLNPLVTDVMATLQPQAEARDIAITVEMPEHVAVSANPGRIKQALLNLGGNSVKYTRPGGSVAIALSLTDPATSAPPVVVTLTDTGLG